MVGTWCKEGKVLMGVGEEERDHVSQNKKQASNQNKHQSWRLTAVGVPFLLSCVSSFEFPASSTPLPGVVSIVSSCCWTSPRASHRSLPLSLSTWWSDLLALSRGLKTPTRFLISVLFTLYHGCGGSYPAVQGGWAWLFPASC